MKEKKKELKRGREREREEISNIREQKGDNYE